MITTIYKCDRCGKEQDTPTQMWEIAVTIQHIDSQSRIKREFKWLPSKTPLWCRECCDAVGLIGTWKPPVETPNEPAPTLEDQLREIFRDEIEAAQ